jgi:predicted glycosyltransferase
VTPQPHVLMFAHDGKGLGHLRRVCRVASALQGDCAVLVISGHRDLSWLVPEACEFVHLPSLDSLSHWKSRQWDRPPFWRDGQAKGRRLRMGIMEAVVNNYSPDAIVVDYLPMGQGGELYALIERRRQTKCYLILRGVLDDRPSVESDFFNPRARYLMERCYDRILVAADRSVIDVASEYGFRAAVSSKMEYVGYVAEAVSREAQAAARDRRGISPGEKWVVCSGGGGMEGEELAHRVMESTRHFPGVYFDIILGPRSRYRGRIDQYCREPYVRIRQYDPGLPTLHASADVVVCRGGYNSLMESVNGQGRVIVLPLKGAGEQYDHASRLAARYAMTVLHGVEQVEPALQKALSSVAGGPVANPVECNGAARCRDLILRDLL